MVASPTLVPRRIYERTAIPCCGVAGMTGDHPASRPAPGRLQYPRVATHCDTTADVRCLQCVTLGWIGRAGKKSARNAARFARGSVAAPAQKQLSIKSGKITADAASRISAGSCCGATAPGENLPRMPAGGPHAVPDSQAATERSLLPEDATAELSKFCVSFQSRLRRSLSERSDPDQTMQEIRRTERRRSIAIRDGALTAGAMSAALDSPRRLPQRKRLKSEDEYYF